MDDNDNMTGMSVGHDSGNEDAEREELISTVGDSSVVSNTWNQKVKLLDNKCLFGGSNKEGQMELEIQAADYLPFSNYVRV